MFINSIIKLIIKKTIYFGNKLIIFLNNMETNIVKNGNVNKVSKIRLRVTAMPKNIKFVVIVDSNIQIGKFKQ